MATKGGRKQPKVTFFGHFGSGNFGNESTFQAVLSHLRCLIPNAEVTCICSAPEAVTATYQITALPMNYVVVKPWNLRSPVARLARKLFIGIPSEFYRWLKGFRTLWDTDVLIIPGTGLLTDAFILGDWGPYGTFKWSVIARLCRCQLFFVSVGAGPLNSVRGRFFVKFALSLANFRSYRDESTLQYLEDIGFSAYKDPVYPDLAFSLPPALLPDGQARAGRGLIVGLGLMEYAGMYGIERTTSADYAAYLDTLVQFVTWLLRREYKVRLLIGDIMDVPATRKFKSLLKERSVMHEDQIIDEPVESTEDLLQALAATDFVVATRFHNILLPLLLNKPVIAISFHHKCSSLMRQMGLSEYCQDIKHLNTDKLIEQFCDVERNAERLKALIREKTEECRTALDEQYSRIFQEMLPARPLTGSRG